MICIQVIRSFILRLGFLLLVSLVSSPVFAAEPGGSPPETPVSEEAASEHEGVEATEKTSGLDAHKKRVDTGVQRASQWADQFFNDPEYETEAANSQIRIRPELYYRDEQGAKLKLRVRARLNLPNLGRRVSLVVGADDEAGGFDDSVDDSFDEGIIGLQYDFTTIFHTRPDTHVDKYTVSLRYRKRTRRDWLYYEIVPQLSFENEFGYRANPGIRLRLEFFYGADTIDQFWRRESEDTEDFRW